jgi:phosphate starvation-inducible PhoH-like protein
MQMFLTRFGEDSKVVVTGDVTQIDLPSGDVSGLCEVEPLLTGMEGVSIIRFGNTDVIRHPLVARIVHAYHEHREKHRRG